jgi:hypothetical protein
MNWFRNRQAESEPKAKMTEWGHFAHDCSQLPVVLNRGTHKIPHSEPIIGILEVSLDLYLVDHKYGS